MAVILYAPFTQMVSAIALPDPASSNVSSLKAIVKTKRSLDGTLYTYVQTSGKKKLVFEFNLTTLVWFSLKGFIESYHAAEIKLTDHLNDNWRAIFITNPFEHISQGRRGQCTENGNIRLEFEGVKI